MKVKVKSLSRVRLFATLWTVAYQAPPSMGFSGQEYWSGLPFPSPGDLPNPGIKPRSPALQTDALSSEPPETAISIRVFSDGKESVYNSGYLGLIVGLRRSLEEEMATHSSILARRIPWTEEPSGLQSIESQRAGHD